MEIEEKEKLAGEFCDNFCRYPIEIADEDELDALCMTCPMNKLIGLEEG